jgi:regulator of cell morphogenesis and NO signaling
MGLDLPAVIGALEALELVPVDEDQSWQSGLVPALRHIVDTHHAYTKEALPRLLFLTAKVAKVHGDEDPRLVELDRAFRLFAQETFDHLAKEEQILFPMILAGRGRQASMPVQVMLGEHDDHGEALCRIRTLTSDLRLPEGACATWRELYRSLLQLEVELMEHIHLENNILFPRALAG